MAEQNLFPVFDVPEIIVSGLTEELKYKSSVYFDFERGDFSRNGVHKISSSTGEEAYIQWCIKTVLTERLSCLSYSSDIGTELEDAFKQDDRKAVESAMERTITEALMTNLKTEYVREFEFAWDNDGLHVRFTVKGKGREEQYVGVILQT